MAVRRKARKRRDWNEVHRWQLRHGFDAPWQRFGERNIRCRRRDGATDCAPEDMPLVESAWQSLRGELLEGVDDPATVWAYRRFEMQGGN